VRPLLVGEVNPYGPDPQYALWPDPPGCAGHRLCHLILDMGQREYLRAFDRVNLCLGAWSTRQAREAASKILRRTPRPLILLGAKVADAFLPKSFQPFAVVSVDPDFQAVMLPHPSGRSRLWNDSANILRARSLVERMLRGVPE